MEFLVKILPWAQIILSIILGAAILLQQTGAGVGGAMGGSGDSIHYTRRGMENILFYLSIVIAILFAFSALVILFIKK
ncbi:MAG: preprotein translocase subunit SecG [Candidatus Yonathbacteria bacterium]|nr:preprotein translocase subunit SecG [Candidatus Yonathbacteria bacterium]